MMLAQLLKNGDADHIYVPEPEDKAIRDLCRERAMHDLTDARYQINAFSLRNHTLFDGKAGRQNARVVCCIPCEFGLWHFIRFQPFSKVTHAQFRLPQVNSILDRKNLSR